VAKQLGFLNGLRAMAALWVLAAHCLIWLGYTGFFPHPKLAVAVFMLLSGFLMAMTSTAREGIEPLAKPATWLTFYTRRFFRIAPLYYVVLIALVALLPWIRQGYGVLWSDYATQLHGSSYDPSHAGVGPWNFAAHVSFVFGLIPKLISSTLLPDWSLSLEMQFYLAFPFLYLAVRRWGTLAAVVIAVVCAAAIPFRLQFLDPSPLPLQIQYFLAGMLVHEAAKGMRFALLVALALSLSEVWIYHAPVVVLPVTVLLIYALSRGFERYGLGLIGRALASPPMHFLADLSYGIYLVHAFFVAGAGLLFARAAWFTALPAYGRYGVTLAFVLTGSIATSYVLHHLVEKRGIALGHALARRRGEGGRLET
jgi:peptidoglycan/LPS O-acetylase OafA/YrhL